MACFTDHRNPNLIKYSVEQLIAQRIYALTLGYEDLNDHDQLRNDPLLVVLVGKDDPAGNNRRRQRDKGKAVAGKSTLNRLELTPVRANNKSRYKKQVNNHQINLVALAGSGFACPPIGGCFHPPVLLVVLKSEE